jgi:hypothetical protein
MSYPKDTERSLKAYLANLPTPGGADVDGKVLADALVTMHKVKNQYAVHTSRTVWRTLMTSRTSKLAVAGIAIAGVLSFGVFDSLTKPAWALTETIEAIRGFGAVHLAGTVMDEYGAEKGCEIWMRANKSRTSSKDIIMRITNGVILWVEDGRTYTYIPQNNTLSCENAITVGVSQWPGPVLFEMLASTKDKQFINGTDPVTGRKTVTLLCSFISALGPQSYSIRFDVETKLPLTLTNWNNMDRRGAPIFNAMNITYCENLPDSVFAVAYPKDAHRVEKELTIPESTLALLADPEYGLSTEGLSMAEASRKIIGELYQAVIDGNPAKIKRLCPLCKSWDDEVLRSLILKMGQDDSVVEVVKIGQICKEGHSELGPIVAVPVIAKHKNGTKIEDKIIVQFRTIEGKSSCVVHGPYGMSRELE